MLRWTADAALSELIRRYYSGEAGLWGEIRRQVDEELRRRDIRRGAHHLRLLKRPDGRYDVLVQGADGYEVEP